MEKNYDGRLNKYRGLGLLISKNLQKDSHVEQCPSIEDIAALVDGKLEGKEKEKIVTHLTDCEECYEIFSETLKTILSHSKAKNNKITWYSIPAIALAACLILIVRVVFFGPATNLPYSHEMIDQLAYVLEPGDLKTGAIVRGQGFSGLAGSLGLLTLQQQQTFRMGYHITGLELASMNKNLKQARKQLSEFAQVLKGQQNSRLAESLKELEEFLDKNNFLEASEKIRLMQIEIANDTEKETISSFYHLGMWSSIGQVVFESENKKAIEVFLSNVKSIKSMKLLLEKEGIQQTILESLEKIISISEGKTLGNSECKDISSHIQKIIGYFLA